MIFTGVDPVFIGGSVFMPHPTFPYVKVVVLWLA